MLQSFNKVQIPKLIRWRFKMESDHSKRHYSYQKKVLVIDDFDLRA
jgi:hypothetical protein